MVNGKKHLIIEIIDVFLKQVSEELELINQAIINKDFATVKNYTHTMKSTVSVVNITLLTPILKEMEELAEKAINIERITELNTTLELMCKQAISEIKTERVKYI
ncbi:MAG: hypothetical protein A2265_07120 [Bacteroidetes bacterium RIFOXYA12_FULL_33_9]|nr:MAG: hypothetical protein A2265_07120 [Bacteroidetes bacterium RIFOXYA12_FULL_33_9]